MFYLGQLQATGTLPASNHRTGASGAIPFRIPPRARIYLSPNTANMRFAMGGSGLTGFLASGLQAAPLGAADSLVGPLETVGNTPTISVVATAGGVVLVFAGPRP